ncbi:hypothetical protein ETB97_005918 [Aspergillus alliaceus]|uniref:Uncharacterized protein n=1 Tax=Petromyces alliaceus TaxID=209559 RepID=A0A8H6E3U3_PETAA|nr:hypothetical protein ETB97_005918 [Aspergillus burnettii]
MEQHQPIADSNTGFADTPKRNFGELTECLSDNHQQYGDFGNPSKRARTLGSDIGSPRADPAEHSSGDLDQHDESIAANHGMLDSLSYDMGIDDGSFPECPMMGGWPFEENFDSSFSLFGQSLANNAAGFDPIAGRLAGATSEMVDLTLPDAEVFDGATSCSDPEQPSNKDGDFTSTHNSPETPLSTPDRGISESKPTADDKRSETIHDTCFGYASPIHNSGMIFYSYKQQIHIREYVIRQSLEKEKSTRDLYFDICGNIVIIRGAESKEYAGYLNREAAQLIVTLSHSYKTKLSAKFHPRGSISVMIYGICDEADMIGDFLSDNGYFLQQPYDFDESTTYYNPQYLITPGSEFRASWQKNGLELTQSSQLNEKAKSQASQVMDSASGPTVFSEVQVSHRIKTDLLKHQKKALAMMVEKESGRIVGCEFPSLWSEGVEEGERGMKIYRNSVTGNVQLKEPELCMGGLLADDMGLGKTLSMLALIAGSLNETQEGQEQAKQSTLIVSPLSTLSSWENQIEGHFKEGSLSYTVYHGPTRTRDASSLAQHSIILTTYDTLKVDFNEKSKRDGILRKIGWHRIVLDEATPIQNWVQELGALVKFLRVSPFDDGMSFRDTFTYPIERGNERGWEKLRSLVQAISLRRTKEALDLNLPVREGIIQPVELNMEERKMYKLFTKSCVSAIETRGMARSSFQNILRLRQICNHGRELLPSTTQQWLDSVMSFDENPTTPPPTCEHCNDPMADSEENMDDPIACMHQVCKACLRGVQEGDSPSEPVCPVCSESGCEKKEGQGTDETEVETQYRPSSKVKALLENLQKARCQSSQHPEEMPIKSVIFSTWTKMLDLVEKALDGTGFQFQRIDGSKSSSHRKQALRIFNESPSCTVFLATLGSAGVGIDLTAASQVHLLEPGWNPMLERQALDRVHRIGQKRNVLAIRYIVTGATSIEEYIRRRQEWKLNLISTSLNDTNDGRAVGVKDMLEDLKHTLSQS